MNSRNDDEVPWWGWLLMGLVVLILVLFALALAAWIIGSVTGMAIEAWQDVVNLLG